MDQTDPKAGEAPPQLSTEAGKCRDVLHHSVDCFLGVICLQLPERYRCEHPCPTESSVATMFVLSRGAVSCSQPRTAHGCRLLQVSPLGLQNTSAGGSQGTHAPQLNGKCSRTAELDIAALRVVAPKVCNCGRNVPSAVAQRPESRSIFSRTKQTSAFTTVMNSHLFCAVVFHEELAGSNSAHRISPAAKNALSCRLSRWAIPWHSVMHSSRRSKPRALRPQNPATICRTKVDGRW
jgi:hypothetical protein